MRHDVTSVMSSNRQGRERRKSPAREPSPVTNAGCLPPSVVHVSREELKRFLKCKRVGNYLLGKTIGEGSFAKVKQGFHVLTGEKVAVKIIDKKQALEDRYVSKNMRREARILQMVRHPHIISLLEVVETENRYYLVFELAGGGDLMDYICYRKRLGETEVRKFIRQIISAVQYLHQGGIIHRDLKVENLLLDEEYNIRIIDFGLSNTVSVAKPGDLSPIKDYCKTQCGSPAYAAPEILGHQLYGTKVDVWSIGVNMYAMLTGKLPYTAEPFNIVTLYNKMVRGEMNAVPDRLSPSCRDLLMRFLTFDPDERISLDEAINHVWLKKGYEDDELTPVVFPNHLRLIYLNMDILNHMVEKMNFTEKDIIDGVTNNKSNSASCVYHLLSKKLRMYLLRHPPKNSVRSSRRDRARLRDEPDASTKKLRIEETLGPPSDERLAKVSQAESTDSTDDDARRKRLSCNQDGPLLRDSNVNREDSRDQLSVPMCSQVQRSEAFENGGNCEDPEDREEDRPYSRRDAVVFDISEPCNERKISYAAYTQEQGNDEKFEETEITVPVILTDDTREPYIANGEQDKENEVLETKDEVRRVCVPRDMLGRNCNGEQRLEDTDFEQGLEKKVPQQGLKKKVLEQGLKDKVFEQGIDDKALKQRLDYKALEQRLEDKVFEQGLEDKVLVQGPNDNLLEQGVEKGLGRGQGDNVLAQRPEDVLEFAVTSHEETTIKAVEINNNEITEDGEVIVQAIPVSVEVHDDYKFNEHIKQVTEVNHAKGLSKSEEVVNPQGPEIITGRSRSCSGPVTSHISTTVVSVPLSPKPLPLDLPKNVANASRRASLPSRGRTRSNPSVTTETSTLSKQKRPSLPCRAYPVTREPSPIRKPIQPSEHAQTVPRRKNSAGNTYGLVCQISAVEPEAAPTTKSEVNNGPAKLVLKSNRSPISVHCSPKPSRRHSTPVNPSQEFYKAIMGKVSPTNENRDNFDGRQNLKSFSTSLRRRGSTSSNSSDDSKKTSPRRNRYSLPITPREPLLPNLALKLHTKQPPLEPLTLPPAPMLAHRLDGTSLEDYNRSPRRSRDLHQVRRSTIDNVSRKAIEGVLHEPSKQPEKATRESQDKARQRRKTISLDTRKSRDEESRGHVTEIHVEVKASPRSGRKSLESGDVSLDAQAQKSTGLPRFMEVKYSVTDKDKRHRVPVEMSSLVKKGEEIEDELKTDSQANEHFDDADYNREGLGERDALMARKSEEKEPKGIMDNVRSCCICC
ncbi:uncharacterized protein LOC5518787 isoform X2 [Nematostella vectensis]|uniref:uncharacterized protein LOC5518787 isoform X2 n=1 Tax=Nematostella vectensis TaxID=45351 RepID=UPI00207724CA|nr:uncharacterized protein LOC5518787 isoform X2 [Nematostella vectensis]